MTMSSRYQALDALRGFAMMLGVLLHSALAYMKYPIPAWPVRDSDRMLIADIFVFAVHGFRMQLFFLIGGFFACLVFRRYGLMGFLCHRGRRVAIPLVLAALLIQPQLQAIGLYQQTIDERRPATVELTPRESLLPMQAEHHLSPLQIVYHHFRSGNFLRYLTPVHLWFLYYLILCYALMLIAMPLARLGSRWVAGFQSRLLGRGAFPFLGLVTLASLMTMQTWQVDTISSWIPVPRLIVYYFQFFGLGWLCFSQPGIKSSLTRSWRSCLIGASGMLALSTALTAYGIPLELAGHAPGAALFFLKFTARASQAFYTWFTVLGLIGLFETYLRRELPWVKYLAESSYWCYLMSLTPILMLQGLLVASPIPTAGKFLLVTGGSLLFLLLTYEWLVRYTIVGALLNGSRKQRDGYVPMS